jgi:restriction endonuclease S subunit
MSRPKAFVILFKDLHVWSVGSFFKLNWQWPTEYIKPLSSALKRKSNVVNNEDYLSGQMKLVTLHFDGTIVPRATNGKNDFKGNLYSAASGDVVYSKIDVRNGAIGIVPEEMARVAVSSEFPVYKVSAELAFPQYIKLLFRTQYFRQAINSMISGTSGRKRVQPSQLEALEVPLPPLPIQQAIVERWIKGQENIASTKDSTNGIQKSLEENLLNRIGVDLPPIVQRKGAFSLDWKDFERWDTFFYREDFIQLEKQLLSMKHAPVGKILNFISRPWKSSDFPDGVFEYIEISSVNKENGIFGSKSVNVNNAPSRATTLIKKGDLLISTTRPYLGAFAIVPAKYDNCVCSSGFALADRINIPEIDKDFLLFFLQSPAGLRQMERRMTGGLYPAIIQAELERVLVPVPPLEMQKEIMKQVKDGQDKIARERETAEKKSLEIKTEIEALILGTKRIDVL